MRRTAILLGILASIVASLAQGQSASDESAIRANLAAYAEARNRRDAHAQGMHYTADAEFLGGAGVIVKGHDAIEKSLEVKDPAYQFHLRTDHVQFVTSDVAVAETSLWGAVETPGGGSSGTYVMVKKNNEWLIASVRVTTKRKPAQ